MLEEKLAYGGLITDAGLRRMQRWGFGVAGVWALTLLVYAVLWPEPYRDGWWLVLQLLFVGRTVCAYEGVRLGFSSPYLVLQGSTQDIAMFLMIFPLFVRFYERVARDRAIDRLFRSLTKAAEGHQKALQGYGALGLFLFVFFPISGTGTLVGSVVGYLIGIKMRIVVPVVISAHLTCLFVLLAFFDWLAPVLQSVNEGVAQYFAWIILAVVVGLGWLYKVLRPRIDRWRGLEEPLPPMGKAEAAAEPAE